jgi:hypothetical protein
VPISRVMAHLYISWARSVRPVSRARIPAALHRHPGDTRWHLPRNMVMTRFSVFTAFRWRIPWHRVCLQGYTALLKQKYEFTTDQRQTIRKGGTQSHWPKSRGFPRDTVAGLPGEHADHGPVKSLTGSRRVRREIIWKAVSPSRSRLTPAHGTRRLARRRHRRSAQPDVG